MTVPASQIAEMIRVLIVDDHAMFAESIARLLEREADIAVIGVAADSVSAVALAAETFPDVAIVDYGLPDADGTQTAARIREVSPGTRVVLLTGMPDDGVATVAIQAGCSGFLTKDKAGHELVTAARTVHSGKAFIPPAHLADLHRGLATQKIRSEYLSRVGHEFRTPLTAILGYGRLMAQRPLSAEKAQGVAEQIVQSGERLQRIVEILEFSASTACGEFVLHPTTVHSRQLILDAIARWQPRLGAGHVLRVDVTAELPLLDVDRHYLDMAIDELIDNAVKFSPTGGDIILTATLTETEGRPAVDISVADEGIGMAPAAREMAFEAFMQVDSSDTRRFGGLGLGLSLVRGVAEAHGGAATCGPALPVGTRSSIVLPLRPN